MQGLPKQMFKHGCLKTVDRSILKVSVLLLPCTAFNVAFAHESNESTVLSDLLKAQQIQLQQQKALIQALEQRLSLLEGRLEQKSSQAISSHQSDNISDGAAISNKNIGSFPDDAIVRKGDFLGSIQIPDTNLAFKFGGFAQIKFINDLQETADVTPFIASLIPLEDNEQRSSRLFAGESRLNIDVRGENSLGDFRVFLEGDFDGKQADDLTVNGSGFRLRHAFGQIGNVYMGQYWSLFSDVNAFPETIDTTSPAGKSVVRQTGIRYVNSKADFWTYSLALENPASQFVGENGQLNRGVDEFPDAIANVSINPNWGRISLSVLMRHLSVEYGTDDIAQNVELDDYGFGFNLTGRVSAPWSSFQGSGLSNAQTRNNIVFGLTACEGIARYLIELGFDGLDAVLQSDSQLTLEPIKVAGGYVAKQIWWSDNLRSNFTMGRIVVDDHGALSDSAIRQLTTASVNIMYNPYPGLTFGLESIYGKKNRTKRSAQ